MHRHTRALTRRAGTAPLSAARLHFAGAIAVKVGEDGGHRLVAEVEVELADRRLKLVLLEPARAVGVVLAEEAEQHRGFPPAEEVLRGAYRATSVTVIVKAAYCLRPRGVRFRSGIDLERE